MIKSVSKRKAIKIYRKNRKEYQKKIQGRTNYTFFLDRVYDYPCLEDRFESAGQLGIYFWQDLWASRLICEKNPLEHYDIGSSMSFIGHLATFRDRIHLIDVRPLEYDIPGVSFYQADATNLDNISSDSVESLSALCSLEHFGLGRYGDPIDPDSWYRAMKSIVRVIKPGGDAYISVPIGWEHVEYDAHRIFFAQTVIEAFSPMELVSLSCVCLHSDEVIEENVPIHKYDDEINHADRFGLFHFHKIDE